MAKHFGLEIGDDSFASSRKEDQILAEAALDGVYVVRSSSAHAPSMGAAQVVEAYKDLKLNEAGFRSLKIDGLDVRSIYDRTEGRARAHVFICMLASYLVWHLRRAWAPLCFSVEPLPARAGPVAPAEAVAKASRKRQRKG